MIKPPICLRVTDPVYTLEALSAKIEGMVELWGKLSEDGIPRDVTVIESLGFGLDQKAIQCVGEWRFTPPVDAEGRPTSHGCKFYVKFELPSKSEPL
jgi:periplasmic protein TonB